MTQNNESIEEIKKKIELLGDITPEQRGSIICSLIGHSNIVHTFFGYVYCGRCNAEIGDSLGSYYSNPNVVIQGHKCKTCKDNYKKCTWKDKLYVKDPMMSDPFFEEDKRPYVLEFNTQRVKQEEKTE